MKASDETISNGIPIAKASFETVRFPKKLGIPATAKTLNVFEPNTFPRATECFPAIAERTDIIISGKLVPKATASIVIIEGAIPSIFAIFETLSITYLEEIKINKTEIKAIIIDLDKENSFFSSFFSGSVTSCFIE